MSMIGKITYKAPAGTESMGEYFSKGLYNVFIYGAVMGVLSSAMLLLSISGKSANKKALKRTTIVLAAMSNVLFYATVYAIFLINKDEMFIFPLLLWALCSLICAILLVCLKMTTQK